MEWFVYVLKLKNGKYYVGSTNNLQRRLDQHHQGKNLATKHLRPIELLWYKKFAEVSEARKMEYYIKKQKDRKYIEYIMDS